MEMNGFLEAFQALSGQRNQSHSCHHKLHLLASSDIIGPQILAEKVQILMNLSFNSHPLSSPLSYPAHGFPLTSPWWMIGLATGWTITHGNWLWRGLADSTSFTSRLMAASALHLGDSWVTRAKNSSRFTKRWMNESEFGSQITHRARMVLLNLFTTVTEV